MLNYCHTLIFCLFLLLAATDSRAQQKYSVNGTIHDKKTGEVLIGATVSFLEIHRSGITSNSYGFYSITAQPGNYTMIVSFAGYEQETLKIELKNNILLPVELAAGNNQLAEVVVSARKRNENVTKPLMGVQKLTTSEIQNIPVIFGEKDVLKTIQLLPGIQFAGDGNSGFFVRGGGAISFRLNAEGPIVRDKGSFSISARRTYADLFLRLSNDSSVNNNSLYFYDLNMKANYKFDEKNRIYLSGYFGRDNLGFGNTFGIESIL